MVRVHVVAPIIYGGQDDYLWMDHGALPFGIVLLEYLPSKCGSRQIPTTMSTQGYHPADMPPGERAAWANGFEAGQTSMKGALETAREWMLSYGPISSDSEELIQVNIALGRSAHDVDLE